MDRSENETASRERPEATYKADVTGEILRGVVIGEDQDSAAPSNGDASQDLEHVKGVGR